MRGQGWDSGGEELLLRTDDSEQRVLKIYTILESIAAVWIS